MSGTLCTAPKGMISILKKHTKQKKNWCLGQRLLSELLLQSHGPSSTSQVAYQQEPWKNQSSKNWSWESNLRTPRKANPSAPLPTQRRKNYALFIFLLLPRLCKHTIFLEFWCHRSWLKNKILFLSLNSKGMWEWWGAKGTTGQLCWKDFLRMAASVCIDKCKVHPIHAIIGNIRISVFSFI